MGVTLHQTPSPPTSTPQNAATLEAERRRFEAEKRSLHEREEETAARRAADEEHLRLQMAQALRQAEVDAQGRRKAEEKERIAMSRAITAEHERNELQLEHDDSE